MNGIAKTLGGAYPTEQVVWVRFVSHLAVALAVFAPRRGLALLRTARPWAQAGRSLAMMLSTVVFFAALPRIGLAEATVILFVSPFMVMLIALPALGERLAPPRLLAVAVAFVGVVVVVRPGGGVFHWASLLVLACALLYAIYQVLTRLVAGHDRPETSVIYSVLAGSLALSLAAPWFWTAPRSAGDAALMASLGLIGAFAHYCIARAMMLADAGVISPFNYWQLVGAVAVGWAMFGELPDAWTWVGAALIVGAGLHVGWRESRRRA
jgi:drug/metabolite transporter (DMT)-like permease